MQSLGNLSQAAARATAGTARNFVEDWSAAMAATPGFSATGTFNERLLAFLNLKLQVSYANLPSALAAYQAAGPRTPTCVQVANASGSNTNPSVKLPALPAAGNMLLAIYTGDVQMPGPNGAVQVSSHNDGNGKNWIQAWTLTGAQSVTLANPAAFAWTLALYEFAGASSVTEEQSGTTPLDAPDQLVYWQANAARTPASIRIAVSAWESGGAEAVTMPASGVIIDAPYAGSYYQGVPYHAGLIFRFPASFSGYLNVNGASAIGNPAYVQLSID